MESQQRQKQGPEVPLTYGAPPILHPARILLPGQENCFQQWTQQHAGDACGQSLCSAVLIVTHSHSPGLQGLGRWGGQKPCCPMGSSIHFLSLFELLGQETHICFIAKFPIGVSGSSLWKVGHALCREVRLFLLLRRAHLCHSEGDPSDLQSLWVSQNTSSHSVLCTSSKGGYHKVIISHPPLERIIWVYPLGTSIHKYFDERCSLILRCLLGVGLSLNMWTSYLESEVPYPANSDISVIQKLPLCNIEART